MRVTVRLFARLRDLAGAGELVRDVAGAGNGPDGVEGARRPRCRRCASTRRTMSVAVNAEYAQMAATVHDGDEVAFLPPVSGG